VARKGTDVTVERRVIMLSRGGRLGTFAVQTLGDGRSLACLESPADLDDWAHPPVDVVLLDFPRRYRGIIYRQLRQRYRGPVLALLDPGDDGGGLPSGRGPLAILHRPFSGDELSEVLAELLAPGGEDRLAAVPAPNARRPPVPSSAPAVHLLTSTATSDAAEGPSRRSRWRALARRGLRRWEVAVGVAVVMLLGLSFGTPNACRSGCTAVAEAGGAAGGAPGAASGLAAPGTVGLLPGPGGSSASSTGSVSVPGAPPASSAMGGLTSSLSSGSGSPPLLVTTISSASGGGPVPPTSSAVSNPPTTSPSATTRPPTTTTKPPTTTTRPPTTTAPPPPSTTAPAPTTTAPPPTTAATTTTAPPPPSTTAPAAGLV